MIYVALAAFATVCLASGCFAGVLRSLIRQHARERQLLLDQICHLSGKTWTPPPAHHAPPEAKPRETLNPDMLPDWELAELS
jgi:hypothetical protein